MGGIAAAEQLVIHRVQRELEAVGYSELVEDVREVILDGLGTQPKPLRDLTVARALDDSGDDLEFPRRERGWSRPPRPLGRRRYQGLQQVADSGTPEPVLARDHPLDAFEQKGRRGVLRDHAAR